MSNDYECFWEWWRRVWATHKDQGFNNICCIPLLNLIPSILLTVLFIPFLIYWRLFKNRLKKEKKK